MKALAAFLLLLFVVAPPAFAEAGPAAAAEVDIDAGPFFAMPKGASVMPAYRGTVTLAAPFPGGGHVGVVLNRPTKAKLSDLFPGHAPSKAVRDPVHFGGVYMDDALFALVRAKDAPSPKSIELAPGVWLIAETWAIDQAIAERPNDARFFVGIVAWPPGMIRHYLDHDGIALAPLTAEHAAKIFAPDTSRLAEEIFPGEAQLPPGARPARLYRMELVQ